MTNVKEILDGIKTAVGAEIAPKIDAQLGKLESEITTLSQQLTGLKQDYEAKSLSLKNVTAESIDRRKKLSDLHTEIENKNGEIELMKNKVGEVEDLTKFKQSVIAKQRGSFVKEFEDIVKHPKFEKVKSKFKLPEPDKDGKFDLSKIEDADMDNNIEKLNELNEIEYFDKVEQQQQQQFGNKFKVVPSTDKNEIHSKNDLFNNIREQLEQQ